MLASLPRQADIPAAAATLSARAPVAPAGPARAPGRPAQANPLLVPLITWAPAAPWDHSVVAKCGRWALLARR